MNIFKRALLALVLALPLLAGAMDLSGSSGLRGPYTIANRPAATAVAAGQTIAIADSTYGLYGTLVSDGTIWRGVFKLTQNIPALIPGSVTITTGSSGNITFNNTLSSFTNSVAFDAWVNLPTIASTPAITAGWYYVNITNATTGTILTAGPGSAAFNFTVGAATQTNTVSTGQTTAGQVQMLALGTAAPTTNGPLIPANLLGANGAVEIEFHFLHTNSAGNKWEGVQLGTNKANFITQTTNTTSTNWRGKAVSRNNNNTGRQTNWSATGGGGYIVGTTGTGTGNTTSLDTTSDVNIGLYAGIASTADIAALQSTLIWITAD